MLTRILDNQGRVSVPQAVRIDLGIQEGDFLGICITREGRVEMVKLKADTSCGICGATQNLTVIIDRTICTLCAGQPMVDYFTKD